MRNLQLLVILSGLIFLSCSAEGSEPETDKEKKEAKPIPVEVAAAFRGNIDAYYTGTTTLEAPGEAIVSAKVRGTISKMLVEEGDIVREGQIIARLVEEQYSIEMSRAKANLDRLQRELERSRELFDKKLISVEAFENKRFEYESQKGSYELAELNFERTQIKAPISGVISERFVKEGNTIGIDQQVYRITQMDQLHGIIFVPEHEISKIKSGQTAVVQLDALKNEQFLGKVERVSPVVDASTGTVKVTLIVQNPNRMLKPGMFGRVSIVYDSKSNTVLIPKTAVVTEDMVQTVFVVDGESVKRRLIKTGYLNGKNIEILQGIEAGDTVVTVGQSSLNDTSKVMIVGL